jgi:hypothetical protein
MSDELLNKYKAYYHVRAQRYADNPRFANVYHAEMQLYEAINSCTVLEEFREKIGNLNDRCGIALIKDHYLMEMEHYRKHHESVRVMEAEQVLAQIDEFDNIQDAVAFVNDVSTANSIRISMDESHADTFLGNLHVLEHYIVYSNAEVPEKYKDIIQENAEQKRKALTESILDAEKNNSEWQQQWKVNPDICFEHRHFRRCPISADHLHELRNFHKTILNR